MKPCAATTRCQRRRFTPLSVTSAACIRNARSPGFSDIPQILPTFSHGYADSENTMRQRNNAKTPRTPA
ncbi:hypothetical protein E6A25_15480 [Escherichia coli]|nr:hypothetical protein [Escherichia coli]EAA4756846.1 hypothetical protein [Shigella sonnei]EFX6129479.1 hypothetical protein [Shigella boydii]EAB6839000.1 hypothetical protein [Escherichia coli]EEV5896320.1 hypothetical protein [Escherichia coli]